MYKSLLENCSSRANARTFSPPSIRFTIPSLNARLKTRCDDLGLDIRSPMENCPLFSVSHFWGALQGLSGNNYRGTGNLRRPTWRLRLPGHEGEKCWFAASKSKVTNADASRDAGHEIRPVSATSVPLPRPRSQDTLADAERGPLSILIWGRPMGVDATWEEMFAGRARGAE